MHALVEVSYIMNMFAFTHYLQNILMVLCASLYYIIIDISKYGMADSCRSEGSR